MYNLTWISNILSRDFDGFANSPCDWLCVFVCSRHFGNRKALSYNDTRIYQRDAMYGLRRTGLQIKRRTQPLSSPNVLDHYEHSLSFHANKHSLLCISVNCLAKQLAGVGEGGKCVLVWSVETVEVKAFLIFVSILNHRSFVNWGQLRLLQRKSEAVGMVSLCGA